MSQVERVNAIVLAGGQSQRFGRDKLTEQIGGLRLIEHVLERLSGISRRILVVGSRNRTVLSAANRIPLQAMDDIYPGKGTLGGLYTGLLASDTEYNIAVAGDAPFLNRDLLVFMVSLAPGFDAVVPKLGEYLEPLYAVYSKSCLAPMEEALHRGLLSIIGLLPALNVRYVIEDEVNRYDADHLSFMNINTQADLERARLLATRHPLIPSYKGSGMDSATASAFQQPGGKRR